MLECRPKMMFSFTATIMGLVNSELTLSLKPKPKPSQPKPKPNSNPTPNPNLKALSDDESDAGRRASIA